MIGCGKRRWVLGLAAIGVALGSAAGVYWRLQPEPAPTFPVPAYTKSPYLNTEPGTAYIGTAACGACHRSHQQSYSHMRDRDFAAAIDHLQKLNQIYHNPDIPYSLAVCSLEQKQPDRAISAFQQALARRPYAADTHQRLAEVYRATGQSRLAQEHFEKARLLVKRGAKE